MSLVELFEFIVQYLNIDLDYDIIEDDYCYCNHEDYVISMNIDDAYYNCDKFMDFAATMYPKARDFSVVFWSFLHEIGHTKEEAEDYNDLVLRTMLNIAPSEPLTAEAYFRLPSERAATKYAADFISANYEKCKVANDIIEDWLERNDSK